MFVVATINGLGKQASGSTAGVSEHDLTTGLVETAVLLCVPYFAFGSPPKAIFVQASLLQPSVLRSAVALFIETRPLVLCAS